MTEVSGLRSQDHCHILSCFFFFNEATAEDLDRNVAFLQPRPQSVNCPASLVDYMIIGDIDGK